MKTTEYILGYIFVMGLIVLIFAFSGCSDTPDDYYRIKTYANELGDTTYNVEQYGWENIFDWEHNGGGICILLRNIKIKKKLIIYVIL